MGKALFIMLGCISIFGMFAGGCNTDESISVSPRVEWAKTFGGSGDDLAMSIQQTIDGGYIVVGLTASYGVGETDFLLVKTDERGKEQWEKTFGGTDDDMAWSVQQTSDGGYIIAGGSVSYGAGKSDFWLVKTNARGEEEWSKTFGGPSDDAAWSVRQTSDGGYIIAGYTESYGAGNEDLWLVKTDKMGEEEWSNTFGGPDDDRAYYVQQSSDGGYIIAGSTESYGVGQSDFWLLKVGEGGEEEWSKTWGGRWNDEAMSVRQTSDGGYIAAGLTRSYGAGGCDVLVVKMNDEGDEEWSKTYGGPGDDSAMSVQQASDGGYIVAGVTYSYSVAGWSDLWLVKTNMMGERQWSKAFGGSGEDMADSIQRTSDDGYIIAGWTTSHAGGQDFWVVKLK